MASVAVCVVLDKLFRRVSTAECRGTAQTAARVCFSPSELGVFLTSVFCLASTHKSGEIILLYQPFGLNRFKRSKKIFKRF